MRHRKYTLAVDRGNIAVARARSTMASRIAWQEADPEPLSHAFGGHAKCLARFAMVGHDAISARRYRFLASLRVFSPGSSHSPSTLLLCKGVTRRGTQAPSYGTTYILQCLWQPSWPGFRILATSYARTATIARDSDSLWPWPAKPVYFADRWAAGDSLDGRGVREFTG
ncbi:hypothetical protein BCR44DRAFT_1203154 [Catenaria anguillulae PL171]|uniref:Uncharacterized protein n=1 Tax=Catenaria anguillulae PL171 TaxID=765915 RepID=A0A1Y2HIC5_9FUNG|nr:hypothetical protein BCR44DRAFT_1203154 [Catenaria anguillulae PL171]